MVYSSTASTVALYRPRDLTRATLAVLSKASFHSAGYALCRVTYCSVGSAGRHAARIVCGGVRRAHFLLYEQPLEKKVWKG